MRAESLLSVQRTNSQPSPYHITKIKGTASVPTRIAIYLQVQERSDAYRRRDRAVEKVFHPSGMSKWRIIPCKDSHTNRRPAGNHPETPVGYCNAQRAFHSSSRAKFLKPTRPCSTICNLRQIFRHLHEIAIQIGIDKKALLRSRQHHFSLADNNRRRSCQVR